MSCKQVLSWIGKAVVAGGLSMAVLTVFCIFYSYNGLHVRCETGATDYTWGPHQLIINMSEGFYALHTDVNGYMNAEPIPESGVDILLLGSSHTMGMGVSLEDNAGHLLNEMLPDMYTYNIGMDHHYLYSCVNNLQSAMETFDPHKYVVFEANSIELTVDEMREVLDGKHNVLPTYENGIMYYMQKYIPVAKQAYRQLRSAGLVERSNAVVEKQDYTSDEYRQTLDEFLDMAVAPLGEDVRLIIVIHPTTELNENGELVLDMDQEALRSFSDSCKKHGIILADLTEDYMRLYEEEHRLPYGFLNTHVGRGHMNKAGHRVMAERISAEITALEQ